MEPAVQEKEEPPAAPPAWLVPAGLGLLFVWFASPIISQLVWVYENIGDYSHGYLVPIVSVYTARILWPSRGRSEAQPTWLGLPLVVMGLAVATLGLWYEGALRPRGLGSEFVCAGGLLLFFWGAILSWIGPSRFRFFWFPLFFLVFAVPLPETLTLQVTLPLRGFISILAGKLISAVGIPVYQEGNLLHLAGVSLGVEDACSGIRSLWTLLAGALAIGFVAGCRKAQLVVVTLLAIPLAIAQNLMRVFVTSLLCNTWGLVFAEGWRHELIGWLTFVLALVALIWIAMKMTVPQPAPDEAAPAPIAGAGAPLLAIAMALVLAAVSRMIIAAHYDDPGRTEVMKRAVEVRKALEELPRDIGGFTRIGAFELPPRQLRKLGCDDHLTVSYSSSRGIPVTLMMFYWNPVRYGEHKLAAPHSPDVCFPSTGWTRAPEGDLDELLPPKEYVKGMVRLYRNGLQEKVVIYRCSDYWPAAARFSFTALRARLGTLLASWKDPERVLGAQFSVAVYTDSGLDPVEDARAEALRFTRQLDPLLAEFGMVPTHMLDL